MKDPIRIPEVLGMGGEKTREFKYLGVKSIKKVLFNFKNAIIIILIN